jgi:predicted ATPase
MPIEQFTISNKDAIKLARCEKVPPLMVIAGPNGVGKSTLLEALKRNIPSGREPNVQIKATPSSTPLYISPHRVFVPHEIHRLLPLLASRKFRETLRSEILPGLPSYLGGIPSYLTGGVSRDKNQPDFAPSDVKRRIAEIDAEFDHILRIVYDKYDGTVPPGVLPKDHLKPLRDFVERFLHLKLKEVKIEGNSYRVYFINRLGIPVEYNALSSGEKDAIAMMFPFIEKRIENELARAKGENLPNEDIVVLIDGPEEYLHPSLQRAFIEYLRGEIKEASDRGEKLQFIIATHSPTIVNEATIDELYVMLFPDQVSGGNQLIRVTDEVQKLKVIKDFLGDVSILATGKPLLILEGPQDANVVKILFPDIEKEFVLRYFGGKGEIKKLIKALQEVMPELWHKGFRMFAILDKDREEVKNLDKLGSIHLLPVACMENLLLSDVEAIYGALTVLAGYEKLKEKGIKSVQDLEKLIDKILRDPDLISKEIKRRIGAQIEIKYSIKDFNIETLTNSEKIKESIVRECIEPKILQLVRKVNYEKEKIDDIISQGRSKVLKEFSGKVILGKLSKEFSVERDVLGREIANQMRTLGRIPKELVNIIEEIRKSLKR